MSCTCEQKYENTSAGYKLLCPHCHGIMAQTTYTTSETQTFIESINNIVNNQKDIDIDIQNGVNKIFWSLI
jgi:hypothetical protein